MPTYCSVLISFFIKTSHKKRPRRSEVNRSDPMGLVLVTCNSLGSICGGSSRAGNHRV